MKEKARQIFSNTQPAMDIKSNEQKLQLNGKQKKAFGRGIGILGVIATVSLYKICVFLLA
jgi:hypothetical protein